MAEEIAIAVVQSAGRYLVGPRPPGVPLAGLWEFPGGKVEPDEIPREAAARECLEETGLAVHVGEEFPSVDHEYGHGRVRIRFFACAPADSAAAPQPPFRFVSAAELGQLPFPEANRELVRRLASLGKG